MSSDQRRSEITATGMSMFPSLWPRDFLTMMRVNSLSTNDIVGFIDVSGRTIAHRLLGYCPLKKTYLTAGDSNRGVDAPIPEHAILGKVIQVRRMIFGTPQQVPPLLWQNLILPWYMGKSLWKLIFWLWTQIPFDLRNKSIVDAIIALQLKNSIANYNPH